MMKWYCMYIKIQHILIISRRERKYGQKHVYIMICLLQRLSVSKNDG